MDRPRGYGGNPWGYNRREARWYKAGTFVSMTGLAAGLVWLALLAFGAVPDYHVVWGLLVVLVLLAGGAYLRLTAELCRARRHRELSKRDTL